MNITKKLSPNYTGGRDGTAIDRIVIHWIGQGTADSAANWFASTNSQVSAHYIIGNDVVYQCVEEKDTAWHAGNWEMNQRSIGVEHEATPDLPPTAAVYEKSGQLVREISSRYNIPLDREHIIGHNEVKSTQCPGTIDIDKIIRLAKEEVCDCEKLEKEIEELEETLEGVRNSRDRWKNQAEECDLARQADAKTIAELKDQIEGLNETNAKLNESNGRLSNENDKLTKKNEALEKKNEELTGELNGCVQKADMLMKEVYELKTELATCEKKCQDNLCEYSMWEMFSSLWKCRN